jgi:hypothetical protein
MSDTLDEDVAYLRARIPPAALAELADAIRAGGHTEVTIDAPPGNGQVAVGVVRRKHFGGKKTA